ncbi:TIGR02391 family protein [Patulibacter sp. S7RM1-6]
MSLGNPDELLQLPIDELALRVLHSMGPNEVSRTNLIASATSDHWPDYAMAGTPRPRVQKDVFEQAVSEALDWLFIEGLVVHDAYQTRSSSSGWFRRSELGRRVVHEGARGQAFHQAQRLLRIPLHDAIDGRVRRQLLLGESEPAVMIALKEVEVRMRDAGRLADELVGVKLATAAFKPGEGPLHDASAEGGEQEAAMSLFRGAMGFFRNPVAHRRVDYDDPVEAVEVILFADLLLRMIDRAADA